MVGAGELAKITGELGLGGYNGDSSKHVLKGVDVCFFWSSFVKCSGLVNSNHQVLHILDYRFHSSCG